MHSILETGDTHQHTATSQKPRVDVIQMVVFLRQNRINDLKMSAYEVKKNKHNKQFTVN